MPPGHVTTDTRQLERRAGSPLRGDFLLYCVACFLRAFFNVVTDVFHALLNAVPCFLRPVARIFGCVLGRVRSLVGGLVDAVLSFLGDFLGAMFGIFGRVLGRIRGFVGRLVSGVSGFLDYFFGHVSRIFGCVLGGVRGLISRFVDVGFDVLRVGERCQAEQHACDSYHPSCFHYFLLLSETGAREYPAFAAQTQRCGPRGRASSGRYAQSSSPSSAVRVSSSTSHFFRMAKIVLAPNPARINWRKTRAASFWLFGFCRRLRCR